MRLKNNSASIIFMSLIQGLFRIPGNAKKVARLKACFDAGDVDLTDYDMDPHSIAGIKQFQVISTLICSLIFRCYETIFARTTESVDAP